jgi:hypothetical protein
LSYYSRVRSLSLLACSQRLLSLFALVLLLLAGSLSAHGQARINADSATKARQQALVVMREAQKRSLDSARTARQHAMDSLKAARQERTDSLMAIRKYRESKRFRDSVAAERADKIATIREAQQNRLDSMKAARERVTDSVVSAREAATAIIRKGQQRRTDSLASIKKYKTSKRYADSVAIRQKARTDSVASARKAFSDSLTAVRKANMDQLKAARKVTTDSLTAVRKLRTDSLTAKKKVRDAATAQRQDKQVRDKKQKEKQAESKAQLAFELKIKQKRAVYSNEKMLKKKWSAPRKAVQNTFTHYNYYFNANRKMEEAEANMQRVARDKWDERIELYSFNPVTDSASFSADMDSVIQKTSLGIQIHDPRTKWGDDLYLLLGKAYFYKGSMDNAANSFKYIVALQEKAKAEAAKRAAEKGKTAKKKEPSFVTPEDQSALDFLKREPANNAALLWLARTYTTYGHYSEAESILDLLGSDPNMPKDLQGQLALEKGFLAVKQRNNKEAAAKLSIAAADKSIPVNTRRRAAYLAGQIYQDERAYNEAAAQYATVSSLNPKIDMDFYARRNRAYALMQSGGVQKDAIASLKSMLGDNKFAPYYEQVYYVLGRLSANAGNNAEAVSYLRQGLSTPKSTRKQKAMSFASLGNIYFSNGSYDLAKVAYDSVSRFAPAAPDDSAVAIAMRRASLVDKIAGPAYVVRQQDSLLALAAMTEKDQRSVIRRQIKTMRDRKADSAFRAENSGLAEAATKDNSDARGGDLTASSWYFANPAQMQQGMTEFKRKWGIRASVDNWRRSSAVAAAANTNQGASPENNSAFTADLDATAPAASLDENGIPTEEAFMVYIPKTSEAKAVAIGRLQRAYVDMSTAYVRQFEDYTRASAMLDSLDRKWYGSPYAAEAAYLRYTIALRRNDLKEAQRWSDKLQKEHSSSQYAGYVAPAPGETTDSGPAMASVGEYYDATYSLLQQREYGEVLSRTRSARRQYSDEKYNNRFRIVEAMAYAGTAQYNEADTILNDFIRNNGSDPLKPWAEQVLSYVSERRKLEAPKTPPVTPPAAPASGNVNNAPPNVAVNTPITQPAGGPSDPAANNVVPPAINTPVNSKPAAPASISPLPETLIAPAAPTGTRPVDTSGPIPAEYAFKATEPHYFVFAFNKVEQKAMGVKAGIADLNTFKFSSVSLDASMVPMKAGKGIIVVKTFKNAGAARTYLSSFRDAKMLVREYQPNEYQTFVISASNYRKLINDGSINSYMPFYRAHY